MNQPLALIFSGQGAQYVGMGKSLTDQFPETKNFWKIANDVLGYDLMSLCFEGPEDALTQTKVCQPALYVHGYIAFSILKSLGKLNNLTTVLGLSLGELTALAVAEVYDFSTGLKIVHKRATSMQQACESTEGAMTSLIGGSLELAQKLCQEFSVEIANLNCPGQIVISGHKDRIHKATEAGKSMGFKTVIPLKVAGAYHSSLMQSAADSFGQFLKDIPFKSPKYQVISNTTADLSSNPATIKELLVKQVVSSVRWDESIRKAHSLGISHFYECGPNKILKNLAKRIDPNLVVHDAAEASDISALLESCSC